MYHLTFLLFALLHKTVQGAIKGVAAFGFETEHQALMCDWQHDADWHFAKMHELGFTHVRLPFSYRFVEQGNWGAMDSTFDAADKHDLKVALDFHRIENTQQAPKPYTDAVPFHSFLDAWTTILDRYRGRSSLVAVDLFNEFQSGDTAEWSSLATRALNYLEAVFPERFTYYVGGVNWGNTVAGVSAKVAFPERVVYTMHKYAFTSQEPYEANWDAAVGDHFGNVNIGEWGFISDNPEQVAWAERFVDWMIARNITESYAWAWSYNSGDTGGILRSDCESIEDGKMALLHRLWGDPAGTPQVCTCPCPAQRHRIRIRK